jgi:hypothetical protein
VQLGNGGVEIHNSVVILSATSRYTGYSTTRGTR